MIIGPGHCILIKYFCQILPLINLRVFTTLYGYFAFYLEPTYTCNFKNGYSLQAFYENWAFSSLYLFTCRRAIEFQREGITRNPDKASNWYASPRKAI